MLLHETAKAGEVGCHTGDAHHCAFGCQGKQTKGLAADQLLYPLMYSQKKKDLVYLVIAMFTLCQAQC